ncbi:hypothetical protein STEG23_010780, partial [Scotinomys teguina]
LPAEGVTRFKFKGVSSQFDIQIQGYLPQMPATGGGRSFFGPTVTCERNPAPFPLFRVSNKKRRESLSDKPRCKDDSEQTSYLEEAENTPTALEKITDTINDALFWPYGVTMLEEEGKRRRRGGGGRGEEEEGGGGRGGGGGEEEDDDEEEEEEEDDDDDDDDDDEEEEAKTSSTILNKYGKSGQPCLVPDFSGIALSFSPFNLILAVGLL